MKVKVFLLFNTLLKVNVLKLLRKYSNSLLLLRYCTTLQLANVILHIVKVILHIVNVLLHVVHVILRTVNIIIHIVNVFLHVAGCILHVINVVVPSIWSNLFPAGAAWFVIPDQP